MEDINTRVSVSDTRIRTLEKEVAEFKNTDLKEIKTLLKENVLALNELKIGFTDLRSEIRFLTKSRVDHEVALRDLEDRVNSIELKVDRIWWVGGAVLAFFVATATGLLQSVLNSLF